MTPAQNAKNARSASTTKSTTYPITVEDAEVLCNATAAAFTVTLFTAAGTRERYTTLLTDVGETTLTAGVTIAGTIAGGGAGIAYRGRPYWGVRVVENE